MAGAEDHSTVKDLFISQNSVLLYLCLCYRQEILVSFML